VGGWGEGRAELAAAPGVRRVAVAGTPTDVTLDRCAGLRRQWIERDAGCGRDIEDQLGLSARCGHDVDAAAPGPARALADRQYLGKLVQVLDLDSAMRLQYFGEDARLSAKTPAIAGDGRAHRSHRPTLSTMTGLPLSAARSSAAM